MSAALHTIRVDHFNICFMLRRLSALCEALDGRSDKEFRESIELALHYIAAQTDGAVGGNARVLLCKALSDHGLGLSANTGVSPIEPRIRRRLRLAVNDAIRAAQRDCACLKPMRVAVRTFVAFERARIVQFETQVMPLAMSAFSKQDWRRVDAAVAQYNATAEAIARDQYAESLFRRAVESSREAIERSSGKSADIELTQAIPDKRPAGGHPARFMGRDRSASAGPLSSFWHRLSETARARHMQDRALTRSTTAPPPTE